MTRAARGPAATLAASALLAAFGFLSSAGPGAAQVNPIIAATQAPGVFGSPAYPYGGAPYGYGGFYPQPYPGYGGPPYATNNPSLNAITQQQQGASGGTVPNAASQPGATQMSGLLGGGGNGGGGGGGNGGGGGGGGGGGNGGGQPPTIPMPDPSTNYELLQDPGSPVYERYGALKSKNGDLRQQVLAQAARGVGIRLGYAEETARINAVLDGAYGASLDARYDFAALMIDRTLAPPVITELRKLGERGGDRLLYLTFGAFEIARPARLVLAPPTWRDYLYNNGVLDTAVTSVKPETGSEEGVWNAALNTGLAVGIGEAQASFSANLNRLERDYVGMGRYHELARSGAVSLPVVSAATRKVRVTADGSRAFVGERVIALKVSPKFKAAPPAAFR